MTGDTETPDGGSEWTGARRDFTHPTRSVFHHLKRRE